jgi:hypothetical protein
MNVHVFVESAQPATAYRDSHGPMPKKVWRCNPRRLIHCHLCGRKRWAKNMVVKVYYDCSQYFCREEAKCRRRS